MTDSNLTIGKRIMNLRKQAGMTQEQLAEKLGVSPQAVSKWENDVSCPDITSLPRIAEIFGVTTDALLGVNCSNAKTATQAGFSDNSKSGSPKTDMSFEFDIINHKKSHKLDGIGFPLMLITIGAAFLVSKFVDLPFNFFDILWPALLLGWGVASGVKHRAPFLFGAAFIGLYYLLSALGSPLPFELNWSIIWPFALVLLGLNILTDKLFPKKHGKFAIQTGRHAYSDENGFINLDLAFNSDSIAVLTPTVNGGNIEVSFGECTLDFTSCAFAENAHINLDISFGSCKIYLPASVRAISSIGASFGSADISGEPLHNAASVYIDGDVSFGNAEIYYR